MISDEVVRFPRTIDDPPLILIWKMGDFIPVFGGIFVGIAIGKTVLCAILSIGYVWATKKMRDSRPLGFEVHYLYYHTGLACFGRHVFPNSQQRRFFP